MLSFLLHMETVVTVLGSSIKDLLLILCIVRKGLPHDFKGLAALSG